MRRVTLAGLAAAILTGAAVAATTLMTGSGEAGAVANGHDAAQGQFPFAVKLTMTNIPKPDGTTYNSACSASLIRSEWIVTAAHCFHDVARNPVSGPPPYQTTATIGVANTDNPSAVTVDVVDVRQSPVNDVALAKLAKPVDGVKPLRIAQTPPAVGDNLTLAGWGATSSVNPAPSTQLRYGKVAVSSLTDTTALVHGVWPQANTSACTYDSGAPYLAENTLVSVVSDGPACPHADGETTARVDVIADWINQQLSAD